jgi:hypothetical protein
MKKLLKPTLTLTLLGALLLGTGCRTHDALLVRGTPGEKTVNFAGIYTKTEKSFTTPGPGTIPVSSNDLAIRDNPSGNKHTFFWGLITYTDY